MVLISDVTEESLSTKYPKKRDMNLCSNQVPQLVSFGSTFTNTGSITEVPNYYLGGGEDPRRDDRPKVQLLRKLPEI